MVRSLPNLFLIGGIKCGSTTLYDDLAVHPEIFAPRIKEPTFLLRSDSYRSPIARDYTKLYRQGADLRFRMEGSTSYSNLLLCEGVAKRAQQILGNNLKVLFIIREPFGRMISHYRHLVMGGEVSGAFAEVVVRRPELLLQCLYWKQLEPWVSLFGEESVFVTEFDYFTSQRGLAIAEIQRFLGLRSLANSVPRSSVSNSATSKRIPPQIISRAIRSSFYKIYLSALIPQSIREGLKATLGRQPSVPEVSLTSAFMREAWAVLEEDVRKICCLCRSPGVEQGTIWSLDDLIGRYRQR